MKAIIKTPGAEPHAVIIPNELKMFQQIVDGHIEAVTIASDLVLICNEEGRLRNMPYNCKVLGTEFVGPLLFVGVKGDEFADVPCDIETIRGMLND